MSILRRAIPSRRILSSGTGAQRVRQRAWNQVSRRSYASGGHGDGYKPPSDLPWAITSIVVTIPVASWIWSQGPSRNKPGEGGHHGHDEHSKDDSHDAKEASSEDSSDDTKDAEKEDSKAESEDEKSDSKPDEATEKDSPKESGEKSDSDSESENEDKDTPATSDDEDSGKEEDDGPKASTAAMHKGKPHDDKSLSKKSEGVHETAKLTETVDPKRPAK